MFTNPPVFYGCTLMSTFATRLPRGVLRYANHKLIVRGCRKNVFGSYYS